MSAPQGLLIVNLGTPEAPTPEAVRRYLAEFLNDPLVIDIPAPLRWLLLNFVILPRRPAESARAYAKVWSERGSPLLSHGRALATAVAQELGPEWPVELGMRYGNPSIADAIGRLLAQPLGRLLVLPLYPQAADSSTLSSQREVERVLATRPEAPPLEFVPSFFQDSGFLGALRDVSAPVLAGARAQHVLFSFHGLPERHVLRTARQHGAACLREDACCAVLEAANASCYRAQCHATARGLAARLQLDPVHWSVAFQSRLGRTKWIEPYTDVELRILAERGLRRLAVICPGFPADCLETLEEIGMRGRDAFLAAGGEELVLVPCLNAHPSWVKAAAELARGGTAGS